MSRSMRLLMLALAACGLLAAEAAAAPLPEVFPLGQSGASGAVCEAVRDYQDPLGQGAAKAWRLRCRGYTTTLGRIYQLPVARKAAWDAALVSRAQCNQPAAAPGGLPASLSTCRLSAGGSPYIVFAATSGPTLTVIEGAAPLSDILETGLKVALGMTRPPRSTEVRASAAQADIAADFPGMTGLAAAEAAAAADPERLRARGYVQNNEWRFEEAETAFRGLASEAEARGAPPAQRAEALLNLAVNISNNGRFEEAEGWFGEAEALTPSDDALLRARALNYRALHERNRGRFQAAIAAAEGALRLRAASSAATGPSTTAQASGGGALVIGPALAARINTPPAAQGQLEAPRVSVVDQRAIQDAQAWQIIGTSQSELGDAAARASLERARDILLRSAAQGRITAWLRARVEADLARLDLREGRPAQAAQRYAAARAILRTRHAGSAAEAALLLDLGRAQAAAGRDDEALATYQQAIAIFREQRGGLGASADSAAPYFDLLLKKAAAEPGRAAAYGDRFFDASSIVVSSATAETVNRLAARVAAGDSAIAGLSRAFEDARRRLRATESQVAALQAEGAYTDEVRAEMEARLAALQSEADSLEAQMLAANPRYNQLVAPGANAADVRKALRPGEAYVKLLSLADRAYGVLITPDSVKPYAIDLTRAQVTAAVRRLREPLEPTESLIPFDVAAAATLFDQLFGPVRAQVLAAQRLIYEPQGALVSLPVALLVTDAASGRAAAGDADYTRVAWLGKRMETALVVSGASFLQSRAFAPSRANRPFLGFGDPALPRGEERAYTSLTRSAVRRSAVLERVCGQTRQSLLVIEALPETAAEVRTVGAGFGTPEAVMTGAAFSDEAVLRRRDLADYHVLYFATHGLLPQPDACVPEPALVTSLGGGDSDALLESSEILDLKLDADLVVLAACDTGGAGADTDRTGLTGGGEALGGLTRAMIYAGARALVVSHWSVDSEAAMRLMTGFFAASDATSLGDAMRQSQAALQKDPQFAHPYFWAPFTVIGDGARPLPKGAGTTVAAS